MIFLTWCIVRMLKLLSGLFLATWLGIARSQQEDLHYIGVGYNMLTGNPDGSLVTNGGVDPGLLYTRKILEVTGHDSPMRVQIEHRHSCAQQNTTSMYFGTKSYQDKLKMNFKSSGLKITLFYQTDYISGCLTQ